jgi:hypothetical protein
MGRKFYMSNRQKLLFMAEELHKRGFGKLRVIPSLSPSGLAWRCSFFDEVNETECIASNWIYKLEPETEEIILSTQELADLFIAENPRFISSCLGSDEPYTDWYSSMLAQLIKNELPYGYADWEIEVDTWETSEGKVINTLPNEKTFF